MKIKSIHLITALACYVPAVFSADYTRLDIDGYFPVPDGSSITSSMVTHTGFLLVEESTSADITVMGKMRVYGPNAADFNSTIESEGRQWVEMGAYAYGTKVSGSQWLYGGNSSSVTVMGEGTQELMLDSVAENTTLRDHSTQIVDDMSEATGTILNNQSSQEVRSDGTATLTRLFDNSTLTVESNGKATDFYAYNNSTINIDGGNVERGLARDESSIKVQSGSLSDVDVYDNASITANSGSRVSNINMYRHSVMEVNEGANAEHINLMDASTVNINGESTTDFVAINGTDANVNLNGGTLSNVTIAQGTLFANNGTLNGPVTSNGGNVVLEKDVASDQAYVNITGVGKLLLNRYDTDTAYILNQLDVDSGGTVKFATAQTSSHNGWNTLTVNNLAGNGNFYMQTNVANQKGDLLNVTGQGAGAHRIFVKDTGVSPTHDAGLQLVNIASGDATFALGNTGGVVDLGTYEYTLKEESKGAWFLSPDLTAATDPVPEPMPEPEPEPTPEPEPVPEPTPEPDPAREPDSAPVPEPTPDPAPQPDNIQRRITPSTAAVLNMAATAPLVFDAELESVRERLDNWKSFSRDEALWATTYNTRNNVSTSSGAGFDQTITGLTLGVDRKFKQENSISTAGIFFNYSHSNVGFDRGGKGDVDSYALGAYAGLLHNNGFYVDGIVKFNRFENDVKGRMTSGGEAHGDYSANGVGGHLESGMRLPYGDIGVTPYAAFTGFTAGSSKYKLSNGMRADVDHTRIVRGEAGVKTDYRTTLKNGAELQPWLKAAVRQEFADNNRVNVNNDGHFVNDLSGTRGVYQAGLRAKFTEDVSGFMSASYSQGANVESPWRAAAGISWSF